MRELIKTAESTENLFEVRPFDLYDTNFLYVSWLKGLRHGNDWFSLIDNVTYSEAYRPIIDHILAKEGTKVLVACLKDDKTVILGFSVLAPPILHWIYVKPAWRQIGIAKALLPNPIETVTHITRLGQILKPKNWEFNPFAI